MDKLECSIGSDLSCSVKMKIEANFDWLSIYVSGSNLTFLVLGVQLLPALVIFQKQYLPGY